MHDNGLLVLATKDDIYTKIAKYYGQENHKRNVRQDRELGKNPRFFAPYGKQK